MIEQFFTQPKVLSRLREGVFGPYLPAFAASLHKEGYSRGCVLVQRELEKSELGFS
jgi:hypothetical protein